MKQALRELFPGAQLWVGAPCRPAANLGRSSMDGPGQRAHPRPMSEPARLAPSGDGAWNEVGAESADEAPVRIARACLGARSAAPLDERQ